VWQIFLAVLVGLVDTDRQVLCVQEASTALGRCIIDSLPKMSRDQFIASMRGQFEEILSGVADAVNAAPDGQIINVSEEKVRDLFARFRQTAYD
jgi:hypothetical protein